MTFSSSPETLGIGAKVDSEQLFEPRRVTGRAQLETGFAPVPNAPMALECPDWCG